MPAARPAKGRRAQLRASRGKGKSAIWLHIYCFAVIVRTNAFIASPPVELLRAQGEEIFCASTRLSTSSTPDSLSGCTILTARRYAFRTAASSCALRSVSVASSCPAAAGQISPSVASSARRPFGKGCRLL